MENHVIPSEKFIDILLEEPSYKWADSSGNLVKPSTRQLWAEAFTKVNVFRDKKNWITMVSWLMVAMMFPLFVLFLVKFISWQLVIAIVVYSMVIMGTHGTIWFHRYCTHKSYSFRHPVWRFITQNLVIKTFPEEIYVISHHVHHVKSDLPGDPYNPQGGLWYCMLSDVNHQSVSKSLSEENYNRASKLMAHTGIVRNSYSAYQKWGAIASPYYTVGLWLLNWAFWYTVFFLIGGHALATAMFSAAMLWFILVRGFNYTGHGKGEALHKDNVDYDRSNLSINQLRPGLLAGEWHNNHHLFPGSARAGFLPYQIDLAWIYIWTLHKLGLVRSFKCSRQEFMRKYRKNNSTSEMKPLSGKPYRQREMQR